MQDGRNEGMKRGRMEEKQSKDNEQRKEDGRKEGNRMEVNKARKNTFLSRFNPVFCFRLSQFCFLLISQVKV